MIARANERQEKAGGQEKAGVESGVFSTPTKEHKDKHSPERNERKDFCTQAKFAMVGHTLHRTVNPDGTWLYIAGKWNFFREIKGLEAVAAFLALIGGLK